MIADNFVASIYNNRTGMMSSEANAIAQTEDGFIWIGSYAGLTKYDGTGFEFIKESGIASVICMLTDKKGRLWIGTNDGGVIRYEKGDFTQFTMADGLPTNSIRAFATDTKGNVYVATTDKLCKFDEADQIEILSVPITYVESIVCDKDRLVAVSNSGDIYALKEDKLLKLEENTFFNCVQVTSKGLMAGTSGQGVYLLEIDDEKIRLSQHISVGLGDIDTIYEDSEGRIWLGAENGFGFFDKEGNYHQEQQEGFDGSFETILEDDQGNIWFTSSRYGVMKLSRSLFVNLFSKVNAEKTVVNAITFYKNKIYCGTDKGLIILNENNLERYENELTDILQGNRVRSLMVDSKDRLWICSYGDNGLVCYNGEQILNNFTTQKNNVTSNRFRCITELDDGTITAGTSDGINFIKAGSVVGRITADKQYSKLKTLREMDIYDYITKPFLPLTLIETVNSILDN